MLDGTDDDRTLAVHLKMEARSVVSSSEPSAPDPAGAPSTIGSRAPESRRRASIEIALALLFLVIAAAAVSAWRTGSPTPVLLIPIAAVLGPFVGLFSDAPYFTATFKIALLSTLTVAAAATIGGWLHRDRVLARVAVVLGVVLWVIAGLVGFGPQ